MSKRIRTGYDMSAYFIHGEQPNMLRVNGDEFLKVIRCKDCIHQKWCDQCIEKNGIHYHIDFCSMGEKEQNNG